MSERQPESMAMIDAMTVPMPLIELSNASSFSNDDNQKVMETSNRVIHALQTSGFLMVKSHHLPLDLQMRALETTKEIFQTDDAEDVTTARIVQHPTDPKRYLMIDCHCPNSIQNDLPASLASSAQSDVLISYADALERVKVQLLQNIAQGLGLSKDYLVDLHRTRNSVLRLLHYAGGAESHTPQNRGQVTTTPASPTNLPVLRCKAHSDYGSITLLLTDGVPGLQAYVEGEWMDVPHVQGALVVNIGSLLSEWTKGKLLATLHRVVFVDGKDDGSADGSSCLRSRTSLAYFADPDPDVSALLAEEGNAPVPKENMSVADYIQWRSGGVDVNRSGVAFTEDEEGRIKSP